MNFLFRRHLLNIPATRSFCAKTRFTPILEHSVDWCSDLPQLDGSRIPSVSPWFGRSKFAKEIGFAVSEDDALFGFDPETKIYYFCNAIHGPYARKSLRIESFLDINSKRRKNFTGSGFDYLGFMDSSVWNGGRDISGGEPGHCTVSFFMTNGLKFYICLGYIGCFSNWYGEVKAMEAFIDFSRDYGLGRLEGITDCPKAWGWVVGQQSVYDTQLSEIAQRVYQARKDYETSFGRCFLSYIERDHNRLADLLSLIGQGPQYRANPGELLVYDYPFNSKVRGALNHFMQFQYMKVKI